MIRTTDLIWCNERNLTGQVIRIKDDVVTVIFVTGEKVKKNKNDIHNVDSQWRMND
jgi:hypothetical protein